MRNTKQLKNDLTDGSFEPVFKKLYCTENPNSYAKRFSDLINNYERTFGSTEEIGFFSAPGRTEIGGNHTDHQHGCVLAAAVNLDVVAAVSFNGEDTIRVQSEGYPIDEIDLNQLQPDKKEFNHASALIRGIAAKFKELGYEIKGFNAYTTSNVLKGSGLSSSAAFEVLIANIINSLFCNGEIDPVEIAKIGQYAENQYFGKPCGLMDQMASSVGGIISIDFKNPEKPLICKTDFDFHKAGYALCIIDSGADHADLTSEYAAIPQEMKSVANFFGKDFLRDVEKSEFLKEFTNIRKSVGDRPILRALHFFNENERAIEEANALQEGDTEKFFKLLHESGLSSYMYLQNVNVTGSVKEQAVGVILALCDEFLKGKGAYRVHGGGFAGTVQAFVPLELLEGFRHNIENATGKESCHLLSIRSVGGVMIV